jgi:hypothetical protein
MSALEKNEHLLEKIRSLTPEKIVEVEDFVDFLHAKATDGRLVLAAAKLSEPALSKVWDNPDDAEYDQL